MRGQYWITEFQQCDKSEAMQEKKSDAVVILHLYVNN